MMGKYVLKGRVWKFGDDIDTDIITPHARGPRIPEEAAKFVMQPIRPEFAKKVKEGDIIVAGKNFGCGSSREIAPRALKQAGIRGIVAEYFARIFFRNAISIGLVVMGCRGVSQKFQEGEEIEIRPREGLVKNLTTGETMKGTVLPDFLLEIIEEGGIVPYLEKR